MNYTRSSNTKYYTKEQNQRFYSNLLDFKKNQASLLLDSSLIFQTNFKSYTHKIIQCGEYYHIYEYDKVYLKKDKDLEKIKKVYNKKLYSQLSIDNSIINDINYDLNVKSTNSISKSNSNSLKTISDKNINRAKFEIQRLVKSNIDSFKTFITLTFADNIKDISEANKCFNSFKTYIKKLKNDFKYICVPEFQKRGAVHYHLLTNIDYTDFSLLSQKEVRIWSKNSKAWQIGRNIIGWNKGFSLVKNMDGIEVIGYITKYITKDLDNRLFGKRRYLHSRNLIRPCVSYIDINNINDFSKYIDITHNSDLLYNSSYKNLFDNTVLFSEYKISKNIS